MFYILWELKQLSILEKKRFLFYYYRNKYITARCFFLQSLFKKFEKKIERWIKLYLYIKRVREREREREWERETDRQTGRENKK